MARALPVPAAAVPVERMSGGALERYRLELLRRLRICRDDARREALRAALAGVLAEDAERHRLCRAVAGPARLGRYAG